ncbi:hypothetical protein HMPREF9446_02482 [Bacteroides fluxus YIT 12057]|uniref:Uncharacterized protein n=1 Tax=Bacteroides fluxus YIT 12057 TaxID=763034 RepID=F3PUL0_9BACE|nr:hypothetical protein HMPREF9446_02482 [Bacteroides fluxus YIT 12057]
MNYTCHYYILFFSTLPQVLSQAGRANTFSISIFQPVYYNRQ